MKMFRNVLTVGAVSLVLFGCCATAPCPVDESRLDAAMKAAEQAAASAQQAAASAQSAATSADRAEAAAKRSESAAAAAENSAAKAAKAFEMGLRK